MTQLALTRRVTRVVFAVALFGSTALFANVSQAADPDAARTNEEQASQYKPDNTGRNARDVNSDRKTADDQSLSGSDTKMAAAIRKEIVDNDKLSTNGKNVKIIVADGVVTLRGPVATAEEKSWIEETASRVGHGLKVVNQIEVSQG
ncbi:MAG: BON domain-containing protein [Bdellovibrionota bacterium]